jgi:hypothetical protein
VPAGRQSHDAAYQKDDDGRGGQEPYRDPRRSPRSVAAAPGWPPPATPATTPAALRLGHEDAPDQCPRCRRRRGPRRRHEPGRRHRRGYRRRGGHKRGRRRRRGRIRPRGRRARIGSGHRGIGPGYQQIGSGHRGIGPGYQQIGSGHRGIGPGYQQIGSGHRGIGSGQHRTGFWRDLLCARTQPDGAECGQQPARGGPASGLLGQTASDQLPQVLWQVAELRRAVDQPVHQQSARPGTERAVPTGREHQHRTQAEDVARRSDVMAKGLLRRREPGRAEIPFRQRALLGGR